nr:restriction endonuclease subunit S [Catellatospora sp. IY07-71]
MPIRFVARLGTGHTPSRQRPEYWQDCDVPWMTLADVGQLRDGTTDVVHTTAEKISDLGLANSSAVKHPAGTVMLSRTASVGFSAIMGVDMATSQDFATWTCSEKLVPRYLLHALRAMAPEFRRIAAGSTHKTIYMPDIEQLRIPLPPLDEQRRIADYLDSETNRLDQLSILRHKQLTALSENLLRVVSSISENAQDAPMVRLGYIARLQSGITVDSSRDLSGDVVTRPYLRVANVQDGSVALDSVTEVTVPRRMAAASTLRPGDVLMTEGGDLDKLGRGTVWRGELPDCLHQNHVFAVRPDPRKLDADYLALATRSMHARIYFESTGVKTTNLASTSSSKIRDFRVPLIGLVEQRATVRRINANIEAIETIRRSINSQISLIGERRQALITAAVTGQIDVSTGRGSLSGNRGSARVGH